MAPSAASSGATPPGSVWSRRAALAALLVLVAALSLRQAASLDAGFHLRAGEHILQGQGWPRTDPFTYTLADRPYLDTSWGYQVLLALTLRGFGPAGLTLLHVGFVVALFALLAATIRLRPADPAGGALLATAGALAAEQRFEVRPELLSYVLLAGVLLLLQRRAADRRAPLWLLPPVFLVWVNAHGLFVVGWLALGAFAAGGWLRRRGPDRSLLGWSAASVAVGLINPYGWRALVFPFTLATRLHSENVFGQTIAEFLSPFDLGLSEQFPFYPRLPVFAFYLLFALTVVALVPLLRRRMFESALLALPFLYLSASMVRNAPLLAVACLPALIWTMPLGRWLAPAKRTAAWRRAAARVIPAATAVVCAVLTLRVATDAYYVSNRRVDRFGLGWNRLALPVDTAEYVRTARLEGPLLNQLGFGGYLMWSLDRPVFIDGRLEVVGERFFEEYMRTMTSEDGLEATVARYGIGWVVFPYKMMPRLLGRLSRDARWRLVYADHLAVIFVRATAAAAVVPHERLRALLASSAELSLHDVPGLGGPPRGARAWHWLAGLWRRERFPTEPFNLGLFHYFRGDPARAAHLFAEGIRRSGGAYYEIYGNLGSSLYRLGRAADAAACYRIVLADDPDNRLARERLDEIARRSGSTPGRPRDGLLD